MENMNKNYQRLPKYLKEMITRVTRQDELREVYLYTEKLNDISGLIDIEDCLEVILEVIRRQLVSQIQQGVIENEEAASILTSVEEAMNRDLLLYVSQAEALRVFNVTSHKLKMSNKFGLTGPYFIDGRECYEWSELRSIFHLPKSCKLKHNLFDDLANISTENFYKTLLNNPVELVLLLERILEQYLKLAGRFNSQSKEYHELKRRNAQLQHRHQQDKQTIEELKNRGVS